MLGSSRTSMALLQEAVDAAYAEDGLATAGTDLLAVADLLTREKALRSSLGDSGRSESDRKGIVAALVGDQLSPLGLQLVQQAVSQRWSSDSDLVDALETAGASALLGASEKAGDADRVEEEVFRFARILDGDGDLQLTLSGNSLSAQGKRAIVADLLTGKATDTTVELVSFVVTHLRGRRLDDALGAIVKLAAVRRGELSAVVKVAEPLTAAQQERLAAALANLYGQPVQLSIDVDPSVIGGVSVQVGDEIIDGTLANRIAQARRRLAG